MQRIDGPTAAPALPTPAAVSGTPGYFHDGDLLSATPPTTMTSDWANMLQEELMAILAAASVTPSKSDHTQVLAALQALFVSSTGGVSGSVLSATAGHRSHADGYVEQWGHVSAALTSEGTVSIDFPIDFPNACFGVRAWVVNPSASVTGDTQLQEQSIGVSGATMVVQDQNTTFSDAGGGFRWFAHGH